MEALMVSIKTCDFLEHTDCYNGLCLKCKAIQDGGCEPDAENYKCGTCGTNNVMGFEQALLCGHINIIE